MIELRNRRIAHVRSGLALTASAALLFASCGDTAQYQITLRELLAVQQQVDRVAGTNDVSVNLQNGSVLTVTLANVAGSGKAGIERQELFRQIATAARIRATRAKTPTSRRLNCAPARSPLIAGAATSALA